MDLPKGADNINQRIAMLEEREKKVREQDDGANLEGLDTGSTVLFGSGFRRH